MKSALEKLQRRAKRNRSRLKRVSEGRPRLSVFRSSKNISVQIIDDEAGRTLASASSMEPEFRAEGGKAGEAAAVGALIAERAKKAGVNRVVFDRGAYLFHGRVKALADAAREGGLEF